MALRGRAPAAAALLLLLLLLTTATAAAARRSNDTHLVEDLPVHGAVRKAHFAIYTIWTTDEDHVDPIQLSVTWPAGHAWLLAHCGAPPSLRTGGSTWNARPRPDGSNSTRSAALTIPAGHGCVGQRLFVGVYGLFDTPGFELVYTLGAEESVLVGRRVAKPEKYNPNRVMVHVFKHSVPPGARGVLTQIGIHGQMTAATKGSLSLGVYLKRGNAFHLAAAANEVPCAELDGFATASLSNAVPLAGLDAVYLSYMSSADTVDCFVSSSDEARDPAPRDEYRFGPRPTQSNEMVAVLDRLPPHSSVRAVPVFATGPVTPSVPWGGRLKGRVPIAGPRSYRYFAVDLLDVAMVQIPFDAVLADLFVGFKGKLPTEEDNDGAAEPVAGAIRCFEAELVPDGEMLIGIRARETAPARPRFEFQVLVNGFRQCAFSDALQLLLVGAKQQQGGNVLAARELSPAEVDARR